MKLRGAHWLAICSTAWLVSGIGIASSTAAIMSEKTVCVADFGAVGDGRQDNASAIQKALDSGAKRITVPQGVYIVGQTLRIHSGTTLALDPKAVIHLADNAGQNARVFLITNSNPGNGNHDITVEGGVWDGNNEHNRRGRDGDLDGYTGTAINFVNVKHLAIRNLTVRNPEAFSIRVGEVEDFWIEDVVLDLKQANHSG